MITETSGMLSLLTVLILAADPAGSSGDRAVPPATSPVAPAVDSAGRAARRVGDPPLEADGEGARYIAAVPVFTWDFDHVGPEGGESSDRNYDGWPDGWTRKSGPGFPRYVRAGIVADDPRQPQGNQCLRIDLDGGAAVINSPPIPVSSDFSYVLEAAVRTERIVHNTAYVELCFLDAEKETLETWSSERVAQSADWRRVLLGPVTPANRETRYAVVRLHLRPGAGADLDASACFDSLWMGRLPRMTVRASTPFHVYHREPVEVSCHVSGIREARPVARFRLLDVQGRLLDEQTVPFQPDGLQLRRLRSLAGPELTRAFAVELGGEADPAQTPATPGTDVPGPAPAAAGDGEQPGSFQGTATYRPPLAEDAFGFYRVQVLVLNGAAEPLTTLPAAPANLVGADGPKDVTGAARRAGMELKRSLNFIKMERVDAWDGGEFGWSLPRGEEGFPLVALSDLLGQVGIHWLKFPVWYADGDRERAEELARLAERLSLRGIELVGVLDQPPQSVRKQFATPSRLVIAKVFDDAAWQNVLDPILTRLSLKIRWWQLGADDDISFVNYPQLEERVQAIGKHMERFGQEVQLGLSWSWLVETAGGETPPWAFLSYTADPDLTNDELANYLPALSPTSARNWVMLRPLPADEYDVVTRAQDLVSRMLAAKLKGAQGIFIADPYDPRRGLMQPDGSPGELLLPWRTTATLTAGSTFLGSIQLPNGSQNLVFMRGDQAIMAVWNDEPTDEVIYLGDDVVQLDVWGRARPLPASEPDRSQNDLPILRQRVEVQRLPTFLVGINPYVAKLRMSFAFDQELLASVFAEHQAAGFRLANPFPQGIGGTAWLRTPDVWNVSPRRRQFKLSRGERLEETLDIVLGADASSGRQPVRIDLEVEADRAYRFSIYRSMQVGLGDILLDVSTSLSPNGDLVVKQHLINTTDQPVSFNCILFAPRRRRQRAQVLELQRGRHTSTFVLPDGEALLGQKLTLRAQEIGGRRILNSAVTAER